MSGPLAADFHTNLQDSSLVGNKTLIISLVVTVFSYYYYKHVYTYFQRQGIKGPLPYPLVGNLAALFVCDRMELAREWRDRYGKMYGLFMGTKPHYILNDPEVLRQVCIKDFDVAPNHDHPVSLQDYQKNFLFFSQDDQWRRLRVIQSPTFTSGKIKRMYKLLDRCADDLVLCFSEHLDEAKKQSKQNTVDLKEIYSLYTMDAITTAAYTIKLDRRFDASKKSTSTRGSFVALAGRLFEINIPRLLVAFMVPVWIQRALGYKLIPLHYLTDLDDRLRPIVEQRKSSGKKHDDYLQILVDARMDDRIELDEMDEKENHHAGITETSLRADQAKMIKDIERNSSSAGGEASSTSNGSNGQLAKAGQLTDFEIISSAIFLLVVGLETTATLLANCSYTLAFHPDIQQRLYETVKSIARINSNTGEYSFDYEELTSCEYLDAVISETLRILAPVIQLDRVLNRDYLIEKYNIQLRKGDKLQLGFYAIMNDPEYWPEPHRFDPERFIGDNKKKIVPGSYCPFGLGPRHCLGMRFSLTEAKLALAKVLMKFEFKPAPGLKFPPRCARALGLNNIENGFAVMVPRS